MATPGSAEESLRLAEHYRALTDEELIALARQKESLTEVAQHILAAEILSRKLTVAPLESRPSPRPLSLPETAGEDDPYAEDRELVEIGAVWSRADACRLQRVLDVAGIPFYLGSEEASGVDDVTSNFAEGVSVKVMRVGVPWAYQAMAEGYFPKGEPPEPNDEGAGDAIRCPRCRSTDVVFNELINATSGTKYCWTCASCGNEWQDDGHPQ